MGWEHEPETVWRAQELYCVERLSFYEVARETGVAASSLKRWAEKYGWRAAREEIAQAESSLRADKLLARSALLKELIASKDPQTGFAVASLESLALKEAEISRKLTNAKAAEEAARRAEAERTPCVTQVAAAVSGRSSLTDGDSSAENAAPLPTTDEERMAIMRAALDKELAALLHAPAGEILGRVEKLQKSLAGLRRLAGQDGEEQGPLTIGWEDETG